MKKLLALKRDNKFQDKLTPCRRDDPQDRLSARLEITHILLTPLRFVDINTKVCTSLRIFSGILGIKFNITTGQIMLIKVNKSHFKPEQEVEYPRFQENRHMKVGSFSALSIGQV